MDVVDDAIGRRQDFDEQGTLPTDIAAVLQEPRLDGYVQETLGVVEGRQ
jgi:hypothetical protein